MSNQIKSFTNSAKELSRNPLGIIALFIVLVYGLACLVFGVSSKDLSSCERFPLVLFISIFPILVLISFAWLVSKHHDKLYGPRDYRSDESFIQTFQKKQQSKQSKKEDEQNIKDLMDYGKEFSIISEQERRIEEDLNNRGLEITGNTAKVLIHHLAAVQVLVAFERMYYTLFGSQIRLLKILNNTNMPLDSVKEYFEEVKSRLPNELSIWTVDTYLQYLLTSDLIKKDTEIRITKIGKEFLIWLSKTGYLIDKAL